MVRQRHQQARGWPGDVQEEAHPVLEAPVAKHLAERDHVIIMNPDDVVRLDQRAGRFGKAFIDAVIAAFEIARIFGKVDAEVK